MSCVLPFQHRTRLKKYFQPWLFRYYTWWIFPIDCSDIFSEVLLAISCFPPIPCIESFLRETTFFVSATQTSSVSTNQSYNASEWKYFSCCTKFTKPHSSIIFFSKKHHTFPSERSFVDTDQVKLKSNKSSYFSDLLEELVKKTLNKTG